MMMLSKPITTKSKKNAPPTPERLPERGFSAAELLIACAVIGILAAITVPNILAARDSSKERLAVARLASTAAAESTYRAALGKRTYGTLSDLNATTLAAVPLIPDRVDASGSTVPSGDWYMTMPAAPTQTQFFIKLVYDEAGTGRTKDHEYCVSEDQVIRRDARGACSRTSPAYEAK